MYGAAKPSNRLASNQASNDPVPAANDAPDGGKRNAANEQNELKENTNKPSADPSPAARNPQQDAGGGVKLAIDLVWNDLSPAATTSEGDANLGSRIHLKQLGITAKAWTGGIHQRQNTANELITRVCKVSDTPARERLLMTLGGLGLIGRPTDTSPDPLPKNRHRNMPPWLDPDDARTRLEEGLECQQHWALGRSKPLQASPTGNGNLTKDYGLCPALHLNEADLEFLPGRVTPSEPKAASGTGAQSKATTNDRSNKTTNSAAKPKRAAAATSTKGVVPQMSDRVETLQEQRKKDRELRAVQQSKKTPPPTPQLPVNEDDTQVVLRIVCHKSSSSSSANRSKGGVSPLPIALWPENARVQNAVTDLLKDNKIEDAIVKLARDHECFVFELRFKEQADRLTELIGMHGLPLHNLHPDVDFAYLTTAAAKGPQQCYIEVANLYGDCWATLPRAMLAFANWCRPKDLEVVQAAAMQQLGHTEDGHPMLERTATWVFVVRYTGALPDVERLADVIRTDYDCDLTLPAAKLEETMILPVRAQGQLTHARLRFFVDANHSTRTSTGSVVAPTLWAVRETTVFVEQLLEHVWPLANYGNRLDSAETNTMMIKTMLKDLQRAFTRIRKHEQELRDHYDNELRDKLPPAKTLTDMRYAADIVVCHANSIGLDTTADVLVSSLKPAHLDAIITHEKLQLYNPRVASPQRGAAAGPSAEENVREFLSVAAALTDAGLRGDLSAPTLPGLHGGVDPCFTVAPFTGRPDPKELMNLLLNHLIGRKGGRGLATAEVRTKLQRAIASSLHNA